jgi:hypothetical protein
MGTFYKLYLHNTSIFQHKHINAHRKESDKVMQLLGRNHNIPQNIVPVDDEIGKY